MMSVQATSETFKIQKFLELADQLESVNSVEQMRTHCASLAKGLGFDRFLYGAFFPQTGGIVTVDEFPDSWRERYESEKYIEIDPTVLHCAVETSVLRWCDIERQKKTVDGRAATAMMEEAGAYGLRDGISLPVHGAGVEAGMMSLVSDRIGAVDAVSTPLLQLLTQSIHEKVKAVVVGNNDHGSSLTSRECECLKWTAVGKTSWEISRIIGVSESTVIFHLKNAIKKMGVSNRPQAVAKAVSLAKIKLF